MLVHVLGLKSGKELQTVMLGGGGALTQSPVSSQVCGSAPPNKHSHWKEYKHIFITAFIYTPKTGNMSQLKRYV